MTPPFIGMLVLKGAILVAIAVDYVLMRWDMKRRAAAKAEAAAAIANDNDATTKVDREAA